MEQIGLPPNVARLDNRATDSWFRGVTGRMNVYTGTSNPTVNEIPENQWIIFHNTTLGETRIWVNVAGVLKTSAVFT